MAKKKIPALKKKSAKKAIVKRSTTKRRTAVVARKSKPQIFAAATYMTIHREPLPLKPEISHEQIARRAYELWEHRLRIANDSARNWLDATAELQAL
jgi:hypothetical protein